MTIARIINENEIEVFDKRKPIQLENGAVLTPSEYTTFADLEPIGFMYVIEPSLGENQRYGEMFINADNKIEFSIVDNPPTPIFFDWQIAETNLAQAFRNKFFDPRIDKYIISRNLQKQDFSILKSYLRNLVAQNIINEADYTNVNDALKEQNIDLENYIILF